MNATKHKKCSKGCQLIHGRGIGFKKDIAPTVTSKRTKYYEAQGTRRKQGSRQRSKKEPELSFKREQDCKDVNMLSIKKLKPQLTSCVLSFACILILEPWLHLLPCTLSLVLVLQYLKLHAPVQLSSFIGFISSNRHSFTVSF